MNILLQLISRPFGFIGVVLALIGLYYALTGNLLGWFLFIIGAGIAYISEKG